MKSVLSIQSHVCHGYVGGKAAVFPLQCQGWEVDNINTVEFSNHTGYGTFNGSPVIARLLDQLFLGLIRNEAFYDAVISGYMPNEFVISKCCEGVKHLKDRNSNLMYLLDPVIGDEGHIYVDRSCLEGYRKVLRERIVDIITPNQFELELLLSCKIASIADLRKTFTILHEEYNIKYVIISSLKEFGENNEDTIYCAASDSERTYLFKIPLIKSYFTGVGDLFSALLLDKIFHNRKSQMRSFSVLPRAVNQVLTIIQKCLHLTYELGLEQYRKEVAIPVSDFTGPVGQINNKFMAFLELKIVEAKNLYSFNGDGEFPSEWIETE